MDHQETMTWTEKNVIKPFFQLLGIMLIAFFIGSAYIGMILFTYEPSGPVEVEMQEIEYQPFISLMEEQEQLAEAQKIALIPVRDVVLDQASKAFNRGDYALAVGLTVKYQYAGDEKLNEILTASRNKLLRLHDLPK